MRSYYAALGLPLPAWPGHDFAYYGATATLTSPKPTA
jgi:hypothetical protein